MTQPSFDASRHEWREVVGERLPLDILLDRSHRIEGLGADWEANAR